jgi:hypothetical protein
MIDKIVNLFKIICNVFHDENKEYEKLEELELAQAIKLKQESLKKFNGKMHVSNRGGLSLRFKTTAGKNAYHKHLLSSVKRNWERGKI